MKLLLLLSLALVASIALAAPSTNTREDYMADSQVVFSRQRRQAEGDCEGDHCFHGQHYWNLGDYHQERKRREAEQGQVERLKRQAEERPWIPEDQRCEDGTPHCFHGWHIFNLQPYHIEKRSVQLV